MIKEKYIPVKRRQNSVETDRGSYYNKEDGQQNFQMVKVHFTMVMKVIIVIMMMRIIMKIMNSNSYLRVLPVITQNSFTSSPTRTNQQFCCLQARQWYSYLFRISHPEVLFKKGILSNFAKFTGKDLCQSLFLTVCLKSLIIAKNKQIFSKQQMLF